MAGSASTPCRRRLKQKGLKKAGSERRILLMTRATVKLLMMWLLVGPPALCRAGVLVECCDHESEETAASATVESPCCGDADTGCGSEEPAPDPMPRRCGSCADMCAAVVKPSGDSNSTTFAVLLVLPVNVVSKAPLAPDTGQHFSPSCQRPSPPYPPSDLPLLI